MLAVQQFYAWIEYNTSKLSIIIPLAPSFSSGLLSNLHVENLRVENLRLPIFSKPVQITKSILIAFVSNVALVDKFAKQSMAIFHADIDARDVRSVLACSPRSTSRNCERVYTNLSNAFANFGFGPMPFKCVLTSVISALSYILCRVTPPRSASVGAKNATGKTRN